MLDYSALAAMAAVVREGSFERAARSLHVTPSAISQRIRALEERVGCALIVRGQPCRATETGRRLCQHIDRVRLLEHELENAVPALAPEGVARVPLPVAVNADSLATWFTPAMAAFAREAPVWMNIAVDDQDHTAEWLRSGAVLAAVTATQRPAAGCNSSTLGAMRYIAAASPVFFDCHFAAEGVGFDTLARTPSLVFNAKDELQLQWASRHCGVQVDLPRHIVPSTEAFVAATVAGMGWGMHPETLIASHLAAGSLVEVVPGTPLDVPLYWQQARAAAALLEGLTRHLRAAAKVGLRLL